LARIYAYCRTTDDLGDESPDGSALPRLERWLGEVEALFSGIEPVHPVLVALGHTIVARNIPAAPFLDLIEANLMDQRVKRYETWPDLERYCKLSAAPVGRMVLRVFDMTDSRDETLSDDVCIGLQLANHAQDVSRDAAIGRCYLVQEDIARGGTTEGVRSLVARARILLASGRILESRAPRALRSQLALYRLGGLAICDAIEQIGFDTAAARPHVSGRTKVALVLRAALGSLGS
jgi:phytoene/squalene synthetase